MWSFLPSFDFWDGWHRWKTPIEIREDVLLNFYFALPSHVDAVYVDELLIYSPESSILNEVAPDQWMWNNLPLFDLENR